MAQRTRVSSITDANDSHLFDAGTQYAGPLPSPQSALSLIHNIPLSIQPHFLMHAADSANHYGVPGFREVFFLLRCGSLDDHLLVRVLPAIVARLRARDALRPLACDYRQA